MAKECDKPRNPETVKCKNCDEMGHFSRDCTKPRDYSRIKCSNCDQSTLLDPLSCIKSLFANERIVGHTKVRCKEPIKEVDDGGFGTGGETGGFDASAGRKTIEAPAAGGGDAWGGGSGGDDWGVAPAATTVGGGGDSGW